MNVSRRITTLFLLASFLLSALISCVIYFYNRHTDYEMLLLAGLAVVLVIIGAFGKLLHYQFALNRAKQSLDEAQQLAGLGSWERDLVSGKGYWSDNHYRLFNLHPCQRAPGMEEFFMMICEEDRSLVRKTVLDAISSNSSYEIQYRLNDDLCHRMFLSRGKVLFDDTLKPVTLIGTVQDITNKHRQDQFREELLKQKDLFITRLGHDLKTPLTPLVTLLPLIRSRTEDQRQRELLDLCINSVDNMHDLVSKTLQLARLTSTDNPANGHDDLQLSETVDSVLSTLTPFIDSHLSVSHTISNGISVRGNRTELEELFTQLIKNSVRFSHPGSHVSIEAECSNSVVTVSVQDDGIGLLPEELQNIFEDFYKADPSRHVLGSSGLGLTICRRIVENHGGQISATSPGKDCGTTIRFTLKAGGGI
jgi:signal transduction histidine kinase